MKCVIIVGMATVLFCIHNTTSQYVSINHKQPKSLCESSTKNSLIEHFFNIIFTEFHTTPPVCVCVQMCAGQSTYCYPNGCLKRDDLKRVDSPQAARDDRKQYMFIVDEKDDFMKDFLEKSYVDDSKTVTSPIEETMQHNNMRPDPFKEKYNMIVKYKKMPSVEVRYNLREQVKNMKSDFHKIETVDLSNKRWPMNKRNVITGHKVHSMIEKRDPLVGKTNFFMTMLPANNAAEYPPKYFKRDIMKSLIGEDANLKGFYLFEKPDNTTTEYYMNETISLESLIDNLINNSFKTKSNNTKNGSHLNAISKENMTTNKTEVVTEETTLNSNASMNKSIIGISMNLIDQQDSNNKHTDDSVTTSTNKLNKMIISLANRIEKQNNTSMKIAKRIVGDFDEKDTTPLTTSNAYKTQLNSSFSENLVEIDESETANHKTTSVTSADFKETMVTKKNRQRRARKYQNSKNNTQ